MSETTVLRTLEGLLYSAPPRRVSFWRKGLVLSFDQSQEGTIFIKTSRQEENGTTWTKVNGTLTLQEAGALLQAVNEVQVRGKVRQDLYFIHKGQGDNAGPALSVWAQTGKNPYTLYIGMKRGSDSIGMTLGIYQNKPRNEGETPTIYANELAVLLRFLGDAMSSAFVVAGHDDMLERERRKAEREKKQTDASPSDTPKAKPEPQSTKAKPDPAPAVEEEEEEEGAPGNEDDEFFNG